MKYAIIWQECEPYAEPITLGHVADSKLAAQEFCNELINRPGDGENGAVKPSDICVFEDGLELEVITTSTLAKK